MKVAVKYCGGCNPRYNRTDIAARLRADFPEAELLRAGEDTPDVVAVICGCHVACAAHDTLVGTRGKVVLTCAGDYETLYRLIEEENTALS